MSALSVAGRWVWDPAGSDHELAAACVDLTAGRSDAARKLLAQSHEDMGLRAARSMVMAAMIADSDVAETLLREAPDDPEARLLFARVAAARALRAAQAGEEQRSAGLAGIAREACEAAITVSPWDATPWVVLLSVAPLGHPPVEAPDPTLDLAGPWDLLQEVRGRDADGREAHHRFLACVSPRNGGSLDAMSLFVRWVVDANSRDSVLQLLPLTARAERFRYQQGDPAYPFADRQWEQQAAKDEAEAACEYWFRRRGLTERFVPVADLSVLAHALVMSGLTHRASEVLRALRPYATPWPWLLAGDPARQVDAACARCGVRPP